MATPPATARVRPAEEADIPAMISVFLTSFRLHPLFSYLQAPLERDPSLAADTIFFWRRRFTLFILDPSVDLMVVEVLRDELVAEELEENLDRDGDDETQGGFGKSWEMLRWIQRNGGLQEKGTQSHVIVGFATWTVRKGLKDPEPNNYNLPARSWLATFRTIAIEWELKFWRLVYQRKDQDPVRIAAYALSEEELEERYYQHTCYYLDQLVIDFRHQGHGFGTRLMEWGISRAKKLRLPAMTEASPMSERLYTKLGFKKVGMWIQPGSEGVTGLEEPVMRLEVHDGTEQI